MSRERKHKATYVTRRSILAAPLFLRAAQPVPKDLRTDFKLDRLLVSPSGKPGSFDEKGADVPFVFRHEDRFWMTYVGFDGTGYQTGLASSDDLIRWKREGLILKRDPTSAVTRYNVALTWIVREDDVFSAGSLKRINGQFLGVYHAYPDAGYEAGPAVIGLCWSSDLRNWRVDPPCLRAEEGAAWERAGLYKACLLEHRGRYYMHYNAKDKDAKWKEQIGVAWSDDLKSWTGNPGNPIITNGDSGSRDEVFASDPCVLRYNDEWAIFYYGLDRKGVARDLLALSRDLVSATKCAGALVDVGPAGSIDSQYAHKPSVITHDGVLYHFYCAVSKEHDRGISVATSKGFPNV